MNRIRALILAGLTLPCFSAAAAADEAAATTHLNVRTGPGTSFAVIDTLYPGEVVDMSECQSNGWCFITHEGPDGWVSSAYLTGVSGSAPLESNCRFELTFSADGPEFSIVCGDGPSGGGGGGGSGGGGGGVPTGDQACFYDLPNFTGESFCRGVVTLNSLPPLADNRITSVRLSGAVRVRLCEDPNLGGFCRVVNASEGQLGGLLDNQVSSLQVFTGAGPVPSGPPSTYSTGARTLPATRRLNLDNGNIGMAGADIWYRANAPTVRRLVPINGARLALGDGSNRGLAGCAAESFSSSPVPFAAMPVGTYVCARTSEGRISQFRINGISGPLLELGYTTWAN